jgi:hypothetical protein
MGELITLLFASANMVLLAATLILVHRAQLGCGGLAVWFVLLILGVLLGNLLNTVEARLSDGSIVRGVPWMVMHICWENGVERHAEPPFPGLFMWMNIAHVFALPQLPLLVATLIRRRRRVRSVGSAEREGGE